MIPLPDAAPEIRMNDGKADPAGRFVGGTMRRQRPREPVATLWSFADGKATELVAGVRTSNGLAWSEDRSTMFFIDTPTQRVDAFDYAVDTGAVANRRTVVEIPVDVGKPDGMCIDDEGGLWVALWGGGAVHRYVDGELDRDRRGADAVRHLSDLRRSDVGPARHHHGVRAVRGGRAGRAPATSTSPTWA